jgi:RNA polymerase sigma-70 factor (ECF subfamily)
MENTFDFSDQNILLEEIRKGNNAAFEYLFKNYYLRLRGYTARFIKDHEVVRDIIQECFMKVWEKRETLKSISILSLLFTMVRNACLDYLKHSVIVERYRIEYLAKIEGEEKLYHADFFCDMEYESLYQELEKQIHHVIDHLPVRCKEVFILSRFGGLKNREIAEKLKISVKAVENHISRALSGFSIYFKNKYPLDVYIMIISWLIIE